MSKIGSVFRWLESEGNPVEFGDGHAAVIGDETCRNHYPEMLRMGRGKEA
jgi:hypothetical protein